MVNETKMTLAKDWTGQLVSGWFVSEKIFDCRAYWHDGEFWTRSGNLIPAPKWFKKGLPKCDLDGGIYAGRKGFQTASAATRFGGKWFDEVEFVAFDLPEMTGAWNKRIIEAGRLLKDCATARAIEFFRIKELRDATPFLLKIRPLGGEGIIFRNPESSRYETGRSENYLRLKFVN